VLLAAVLALAPVGAPAAGAGRVFGSGPLDEVLEAAGRHARCGLTRAKLAALMLAPVWPETGAPTTVAPAPMTLSRWDDQAGLHSFGTVRRQRAAFWHPGIGLWQFDSAGLGANLTAAQAVNTAVVANEAAKAIAGRWCTRARQAYAWAPWHGCQDGVCVRIFRRIYDREADRLTGLERTTSVTVLGGMQRRQCRGPGRAGTFPCRRIDPSRAQGHDAFAAERFGPSPISAPFYVYAADGKEYRFWLRADTGYGVGIWATRPLGANARTSLTWHRGEPLTVVSPG
jgi:hypothetical protein